MAGLRRKVQGFAVLAAVALGAAAAHASPMVTFTNDSGDRVTTTPTQTSDNHIAPLYGSGSYTLTQITTPSNQIGWKLSFVPNSGFFASANNLSGGMTQILDGNLTFDITFEQPINLTTNIFEGGIYGVSGNGRAVAAGPDVPSGVSVTETDDTLGTSVSNSFLTNASQVFDPTTNTWKLYDQATGFGTTYVHYHVVIDNDLLAEAPTGPAGYASICKKSFTIYFTGDGSSGGVPPIPEPASLGVLALGGIGLLARRRK